MTAALVPLRARWAAFTRRERLLVGIALALAALVVAIWGVLLPLGRAYEAARARHAEIVQASARVGAKLAALDAAPVAAGTTAMGQRLTAAAGQAGLTLQSVDPRGDGIAVTIAGARPAAVLGWIDSLGRQGVAIDAISLAPAPDGSLGATVNVRPAGDRR